MKKLPYKPSVGEEAIIGSIMVALGVDQVTLTEEMLMSDDFNVDKELGFYYDEDTKKIFIRLEDK